MKKFLLTAALILALVTSLTAGTMAYYTASIDTIEDTITTKTFKISASETGTFAETVKIAPGDKAVYKIVVNNIGEVPARTTLAAAIKYLSAIPGLSVDVEVQGAAKVAMVAAGSNSDSDVDDIDVSGSATYVVTVSWEEGEAWSNAETSAWMGQDISLDIDISAEQIVANDTVIVN